MVIAGLKLLSAAASLLLAGNCCSGKSHPQVTAVDEDLTRAETLHRLRQFHGHVGPYAVLGYRLGLWILQRLGCARYFGASVTVRGPDSTPFTCTLDGIQMATGYTLGKGNLILQAGGSQGLFDIEVVTEDRRCLQIEVPRQVESAFSEWMAQDLSEQQMFDKVMAEPISNLWQEKDATG